MHINTFLIATIVILSGCTTGRYYSEPMDDVIDFESMSESDLNFKHKTIGLLDKREINSCLTEFRKKNEKHILFIHPGLIFFINWGGHRARDAGLILVQDGYIENIYEIRTRDSIEMYEKMAVENRNRYLGLHYSMGGNPKVIKAALEATKSASDSIKKNVVYSVILVEPFGLPSLDKHIDLDDPHLGEIIVLVSKNNSILRPNITDTAMEVLQHKKIHILYAEDLGLDWGHFSFLSEVRNNSDKNNLKHRKAIELLYLIATLLQFELASNDIDIALSILKIKYALNDGRRIQKDWVKLGLKENKQLEQLCKWNE